MKSVTISIALILTLSSCTTTKTIPIAEVTGDADCITYKEVGGAVMCYNVKGYYTGIRQRTRYSRPLITSKDIKAFGVAMQGVGRSFKNMAPAPVIAPTYNSNSKKSNILYDSSGCTGSVVNGACTGIVLPNTPKYKCHGAVLHDGTCSGTVQRVY
jgi:hypothetical protein